VLTRTGEGEVIKVQLQVLILAIAIIAVAAGCGGGGGSQAAELTKKQVIKRGDAICVRTDKQQEVGLAKYQEEHSSQEVVTPAGQAKVVREVGLPPVMKEAEELAGLQGPASSQHQLDAIVDASKEAVKEAEKDPKLVLEGEGPFTKPDRLAKNYGFKACAEMI